MLSKSHVWAGIDEKKESHNTLFVPQKEHDRKRETTNSILITSRQV